MKTLNSMLAIAFLLILSHGNYASTVSPWKMHKGKDVLYLENNSKETQIAKEEENKVLRYGDVIHLQNGWNRFGGGYLDTRGLQKDFEKTGNFLCVSTATSADRDHGSGSWKVLSATGKALGTPVLIGDVIHLQNGWNNYGGGYLDTRGYQKDFEKTGNFLCVSTATSANRDHGSGTWKVIIAMRFAGNTLKAGETLNTGDQLVSANGKYVMIIQEDGNLCIYRFDNGRTGGFVWGSMKHGFKNAKLSMQTDGNLVVYDGNNQAQWSSGTHPYINPEFKDSSKKPVKAVLENDGSLKLYSSSGQAVWTSK